MCHVMGSLAQQIRCRVRALIGFSSGEATLIAVFIRDVSAQERPRVLEDIVRDLNQG